MQLGPRIFGVHEISNMNTSRHNMTIIWSLFTSLEDTNENATATKVLKKVPNCNVKISGVSTQPPLQPHQPQISIISRLAMKLQSLPQFKTLAANVVEIKLGRPQKLLYCHNNCGNLNLSRETKTKSGNAIKSNTCFMSLNFHLKLV